MKKFTLTLCAAAVMATAGSAHAGERESLETLRATTIGLIDALVEQGILSKEKAAALVKAAEQKAAQAAPAAPAPGAPVRVQYVPESLKAEIREQIKQEVLAQAKTERWGEPGALPDWLDRISWEGDMRLRYENDRFQKDNAVPIFYPNYNAINARNGMALSDLLTQPCNSSFFRYNSPNCTPSDNLDRFKVRARLGMTAKVADTVSAGFRLTTTATTTSGTGSSINDPLSSNQTMGNNLAKYQVALDLAYIKLQPASWVSVTGGRIANPWFNTELVWAPDLTFDGVAASFRAGGNGAVKPWLTLGAFPLLDNGSSGSNGRNRWLYGAQAGADMKLTPRTTARIGLAYYDYRNIHGVPDTVPITTSATEGSVNDFTATQFVQKGNTMFNLRAPDSPQTVLYGLVSDFQEIDLTGSLDLAQFDPVHVVVTGDYVRNIGFNAGKIFARTGQDFDKHTTGYLAKVMVGYPQLANRGEWQAEFGYRYLEGDAVLDAYSDPDFHLGGTDAKGYVLGLSYAIEKNTSVKFRWLSANAIYGPKLGIDVGQVDLNVRF